MNSEFQATTSSIWAEYSLLIMPAEIFTEMDLKSMTTNSFNFRIITLKFIGIFGGGGGGTRTSCYYGQHHNKGKQQWLNTW